MDNLQTILLLMPVAVLLVALAQKVHLPYPIALVLGGGLIGFIPGLQPIYLDPKLILTLVLPPILYYGAFGILFREFKRNWLEIFSLALGLVFATTLLVGVVFKWLFPQLPWSLAFAFGAIISPPDAAAATTILKRFSIHARLRTILEGESLINDASALVLYRLAMIALLSETFSLADANVEFFRISGGGILVGLILGFAMQLFSKNYLDPVVGVVFSFTIPYVTYIISDSLGFSGVLAVVVNGLIGARVLFSHQSSLRRVLGYSSWDIFIILLNCLVFILIGSELKSIAEKMSGDQILLYTGYAVGITFIMIVIRLLWVFIENALVLFQTHSLRTFFSHSVFNESIIIGWSGMRGIVSLAAALALPYALEGREVVIFITYIIILLTLIVPGLSLPYFLRKFPISKQHESRLIKNARQKLVDAAEKEIQRLFSIEQLAEEERDFLLLYFKARHRIRENAYLEGKKLHKLEAIRLQILHNQREILVELWKQEIIDDKLLGTLEYELDVEETQFVRAEIKT